MKEQWDFYKYVNVTLAIWSSKYGVRAWVFFLTKQNITHNVVKQFVQVKETS